MSRRVTLTLTDDEHALVDALVMLGYARSGPLGRSTHDTLWWLLNRVRQLDPELEHELDEVLAARARFRAENDSWARGHRGLRLVDGGRP